jgi:hypothetical protein
MLLIFLSVLFFKTSKVLPGEEFYENLFEKLLLIASIEPAGLFSGGSDFF